MDFSKTFLVLGSGMTGTSVAAFFDRRKVNYVWIDEEAKQLYPPAEGRTRRADFQEIDMAVASPHYVNRWALYELEKRHIPVYSDVELFARLSKSPILAVTGTNGKSTTVSLLADILGRGGKTLLLGNIGVPCLDYIEETAPDVPAVLEVSSFQLARTETFRPRVAAILNITPDHLDFHKTFADYRAAKCNIYRNQTAADYLVLNGDEVLPAPETRAEVLRYSLNKEADACLRGETVYLLEKPLTEISAIRLPGRHNLSNALCACLMAKLYGAGDEDIVRSLETFGGIPHRIEVLGEWRGKLWVNDSKATNIASCGVAVDVYAGRRVCLIAGGRSVENFDSFILRAAKKVERVLAFGESAARIEESCKKFGYESFERCDSLEECVRRAAEGEEEVVLFSPACKSFDGFRNFEERGDRFRALVAAL